VRFPGEVVQEDAHGVEADLLGPAQLAVNRLGVERVGLPHFELIDGGAGDEVAADEPGLLGVPGVGLVGGPARRDVVFFLAGADGPGGEEDETQEQPEGASHGEFSEMSGRWRRSATPPAATEDVPTLLPPCAARSRRCRCRLPGNSGRRGWSGTL